MLTQTLKHFCTLAVFRQQTTKKNYPPNMNILVKNSSFLLLILATFLHFEQTNEQLSSSVRSQCIFTTDLYKDNPFHFQKNKITFERVICKTYPGSKFAHIHCGVKYIDRNNLKIDVWGNISEPIENAWINIEPYYKYNTYTRIAGYIWENICEWFTGKKSFILDYTIGSILNYSNFNHVCPYIGYIYFKTNNISINTFEFPQLVPSGRYRVDFNLTEGDRKRILIHGKLYFSISDHRIEMV